MIIVYALLFGMVTSLGIRALLANYRNIATALTKQNKRKSRPYIKKTTEEILSKIESTLDKLELRVSQLRLYHNAFSTLITYFNSENPYLVGAHFSEIHDVINARNIVQPDERFDRLKKANAYLLTQVVSSFDIESYEFIKENRIDLDFLATLQNEAYQLYSKLEDLEAEFKRRKPIISIDSGNLKIVRDHIYKIMPHIKEGLDFQESYGDKIYSIKKQLISFSVLYENIPIDKNIIIPLGI